MEKYTLVGGAVLAALAAASAAADPQAHRELEEIVVTATPIVLERLSTAKPTTVLSGDDLLIALAPTIGETVSGEPGIRSTFFGRTLLRASARPPFTRLNLPKVRRFHTRAPL